MIGAHQTAIIGGSKKLWTPAATSTALWLDAADSSTVTTVSGKVSQWNDKSTNGKNVIQGTDEYRPAYTSAGLNGKNVITFDGSDDVLTNATGLTSGTYSGTLTLYFAGRRTTSAGGAILGERITKTIRSWLYSMITGSCYISSDALNVAGNHKISVADYNKTESYFISSHNQVSGSQQTCWINGTSISIIGGTNTFDATGEVGMEVGHRFLGTYWAGPIAEIIVMRSTFNNSIRQKIEGYLAHKWGLKDNLPVDHPYKLLPPYR